MDRKIWHHFSPVLLLLALLATHLGPTRATAQEPPAPAPLQGVDATDVEQTIRLLENEAERTRFVEQLRAMQSARAVVESDEPPSFFEPVLDFVTAQIAGFREQAVALGDWLGALAAASPNLDQAAMLAFIVSAIAILGAGFLARLLVVRLTGSTRDILVRRAGGSSRPGAIMFLFLRFLVDLTAIAAFLTASLLVLAGLLDGGILDGAGRTIIEAAVPASAVFLAFDALVRFVFVPVAEARRLRLVPLTDAEATSTVRAFRNLALVVLSGWIAVSVLAATGARPEALVGLGNVVAVVLCIATVTLVGRAHGEISRLIERQFAARGWSTALAEFVARGAHVLTLTLVLAAFLAWIVQVRDGFGFLLRLAAVVLVALALFRLAGIAVDRLLTLVAGRLSPAYRTAFHTQAASIATALKAIAAILITVMAIQALGVDLIGTLGTEAGRRVGGAVVSIGIVGVLCLAAWFWIEIGIAVRMNRDAADPYDRSRVRFRTVLPIVRTILLVTLLTVFVLVGLSELGVNTAPLLAGAGVVGLAVGFGAQTLVKDVITGLFILFEDQVQVGDVVDLNGHAGTVEKITIRTVSLRDLAGAVHSLPWGEVGVVQNFTRDFAYAVFSVRVSYRADLDQVIEMLRELGQEMRDDEALRESILDDLEMLGVEGLQDSEVLIKARFKTRPGMQWGVGREFNRLLKRRFEERGVDIPFPQRTISFNPPLDPEKLSKISSNDDNPDPPPTRRTSHSKAAPGGPKRKESAMTEG